MECDILAYLGSDTVACVLLKLVVMQLVGVTLIDQALRDVFDPQQQLQPLAIQQE